MPGHIPATAIPEANSPPETSQSKDGHGIRDPPPGYGQAKPASPSLVSWMGTCETAPPSEVLSCQKLEASLQMQSLRTFPPAVPLSYPTKYSLDDRVLRQQESSGDAARTTFQQPEGALTRDFNQFGMDSEPPSYYQRHQSNTEDHFNSANQPSMEAPVTHFLAQASTDPTLYQHHNQFAPDSAVSVFRQQSHSSTGANLYRQSHLPAEALPFCHQTQVAEQTAFQPTGPSSYQINPNQPQVETLMYQHQSQLPDSALYQRQEPPVFHQPSQSAPDPPVYHQSRSMEAPLYHHQNQRPAENQMFREPIQSVTEGPMYHQSVSTVEASLYRNQRRADASMYHQSNQSTNEASIYHHGNQSSAETTVFHHQDAAMFHHPTQPLPGIAQHFLPHGHNAPQPASNFFSQNQAASDGDFFRYQNQGGDNHYQRPNQTNAAYYNLQNLAAVDAQFHHQQNQAEPSFPLHQNQRSVEPAIQNPGSVDAPFYTHRGMDVDVQLCPQSHSASEPHVFQFQNQVPQETRVHHHSRSSAPVYPYQSQVVPDTQIHQQNRTTGLTMVNYQHPGAQDNRSQNTAAELSLLDYRNQGLQEKQLSSKTPEMNMFQYQNQGPQDFPLSSASSVKNASVHHQKKSRDSDQLYNQSQERHQLKHHQQILEESKQDQSKLNHLDVRSSKIPQNVPQMSTRDSHTRNGAGKVRLVGFKSEPNNSLFDKTRPDSHRNKGVKDKSMEHKPLHFNRNTVVSQWHSAEAQRLETKASQIPALQQENSSTLNPLNNPYIPDEIVLVSESKVENISSLTSTESSIQNSMSLHFDDESVEMPFKEPTVGALFVLSVSESDCPNEENTGVKCLKENQQATSDLGEPSKKLEATSDFAEDPTLPGSNDIVSLTDCVVEELVENANGPEVVELIHEAAAAPVTDGAQNIEFVPANAHLLPRPPDILLTVPVDSESESSSPAHGSLAPDDNHPSSPSARHSQEGSDESSPAQLLFESPEDVELPLTPPPTPPLLTPPCDTPPACTPPLSPTPSSPRSSTPPFSSPLSTSPRSGEGGPWDPSQAQTQEAPVKPIAEASPDQLCNYEPNTVLQEESAEGSCSANENDALSQTLEATENRKNSPSSESELLDSCSHSLVSSETATETSLTVQTLPELPTVLQDAPDLQMPIETAALEFPVEAILCEETVASENLSLENENQNAEDAASEDHDSVAVEPSQTSITEEIFATPLHFNEAVITPLSAETNPDEVESAPAEAPAQDQEFAQQEETSLPSVDPMPADDQQSPSIRVHGFLAPITHPLKL